MKILIINGSPKGKNSITLQTSRYLEIKYPEHSFEVLNAGQIVKALEKDFGRAKEAIEPADVLIFSYPVYTFLAPAQLHRFIELLKESGMDLSDKYATQISTSKHFYDVTAHKYIEENCHDLGLKYVKGLSADMEDLTKESGRREATLFFDHLMWCIENGICEERQQQINEERDESVTTVPTVPDKAEGDVVIVTDCEENDLHLRSMIERFRAVFPRRTRIVNIREYPLSGGCLGCFGCAVSGKCVYKDGFDDYLREKIQTAESIVYAFRIKDHSMGSRFKLYDDRQFCNGHRTVTVGMPVGYIISGAYSCETNLKTVVEARAEVGHNYLAAVATDEGNAAESIDLLARKLEYALEKKMLLPQNFYGIGGMKIFRDLIWQMQGMMRADHKFYKKNKQYDFPQKRWPRMLMMYLVGAMIASPRIKAKLGSKMNEGMLMPYEKVLEKERKKVARK